MLGIAVSSRRRGFGWVRASRRKVDYRKSANRRGRVTAHLSGNAVYRPEPPLVSVENISHIEIWSALFSAGGVRQTPVRHVVTFAHSVRPGVRRPVHG